LGRTFPPTKTRGGFGERYLSSLRERIREGLTYFILSE